MNEHLKLATKVAESYQQRQKQRAFRVIVESFSLGDMVVYDPAAASDATARVRVAVNSVITEKESKERVRVDQVPLFISYKSAGGIEVPESEIVRICFGMADQVQKKFGDYDFGDLRASLSKGLNSWIRTASTPIQGKIEAEVIKLYPKEGMAAVKSVIDNEFKKDSFTANIVARSFDPQWAKAHFISRGVALDARAARYIDARVSGMRSQVIMSRE